jgi:hypothetical protein
MKRFSIALLLISAVLVPHTSKASGFEHSTAVRINDHTVMFLLSYQFGHKKYDYQVPYMAVRGEGASTTLSYDIVNAGGLRTSAGVAHAIVLSKARLEHGQYVVKHRKPEEFTLVAFLNLPTDKQASSTTYALKINSLPFTITENGTHYSNALSAGELKSYKTAVIDTTWQPK